MKTVINPTIDSMVKRFRKINLTIQVHIKNDLLFKIGQI